MHVLTKIVANHLTVAGMGMKVGTELVMLAKLLNTISLIKNAVFHMHNYLSLRESMENSGIIFCVTGMF